MIKLSTLFYRFFWLIISIVLLMAVPAQAQEDTQPASVFGSEVARDWFDLHLRLVRRTWGFSPPVASRAFGYLGVTLYEATVPGMPGYQSLAHQLNELGDLPQPSAGLSYHWATAANSALATMTHLLFPTANDANKAAIDSLYEQYAGQFQLEVDDAIFEQSVQYGEAIANAIYEWSLTDGGDESFRRNFPSDYQPPAGEGLWVPTPRAKGMPQPAMQPTWGSNRPFILTSGEECAPPPPPSYSEDQNSALYGEALEIYTMTQELTAEQRDIMRFWADDPFRTATPAGHSVSILTQVLEQEQATLDVAAEAYAKLGIALADAFISCWSAKYQYNLLRPVTYIQNVIDPNWLPPLITPPFPEYPSGHSVESAAAADVLTSLFGEDYGFTDHTHDEWGLSPRSFDSLFSFAEEAAVSRMYGGIHFRSAIENGLEQGSCVAAYVNQLQFRQ